MFRPEHSAKCSVRNTVEKLKAVDCMCIVGMELHVPFWELWKSWDLEGEPGSCRSGEIRLVELWRAPSLMSFALRVLCYGEIAVGVGGGHATADHLLLIVGGSVVEHISGGERTVARFAEVAERIEVSRSNSPPCLSNKRSDKDGAASRLSAVKGWATLYNLVGVVKRHVECPGSAMSSCCR
jgi:hypothetical protein